jgi:hypothetical protein
MLILPKSQINLYIIYSIVNFLRYCFSLTNSFHYFLLSSREDTRQSSIFLGKVLKILVYDVNGK